MGLNIPFRKEVSENPTVLGEIESAIAALQDVGIPLETRLERIHAVNATLADASDGKVLVWFDLDSAGVLRANSRSL